jgi:hypothetical protein
MFSASRRSQPRPDHATLRRRVAIRIMAAHPADNPAGHGPTFRLSEALQLAHDLHTLGYLETAPSPQWRRQDLERALARWNAHVLPDN